ncbi:MAG: ComF family protein [Isosphaeraceae bacterium]
MAITPLPVIRSLPGGFRGLLDELFPWSCSLCGVESDGPFCEACRASIIDESHRSCPRCALPIGPFEEAALPKGCRQCEGRRLGFDAALALGPYDGPIRELCLRIKHQADAWLAARLGGLWAQSRGHRLPIGDDENLLVVPVPLHWWRHYSRGYDQAEALASALGKALGVPSCGALKRVRKTPKLAGLSRTDRGRLMRGAFRVGWRGRRQVAGRTILLVDDILTTGATCGAAARALKRAGARRVIAAVIARA